MQDYSRKKGEQLESSIQENPDLLGKYRHRRSSSTDPRERNRLDGDIKDLNDLIEKEQHELQALGNRNEPGFTQPGPHLTGSDPSPAPAPPPSNRKQTAGQHETGPHASYEHEVFVSYAWGGESEHKVDELERAFSVHGIRIIRDKKDLAYKGSIDEFERRIGQGQCIVLVISDKYLRSEHCMYELVEVDKNQNLRDRIFPIVLAESRIYTAIDRLNYIQYWDEKIEQLNQAIKNAKSVANLAGITSDLDKFTGIRASFAHLADLLRDMNTLTPELHAASGFSTLIDVVQRRMTGMGIDPIPSLNPPSVTKSSDRGPVAEDTIREFLKSYSDRLVAKQDYLVGFGNHMSGTTMRSAVEHLSRILSRYEKGDLDRYGQDELTRTIEDLESFRDRHSADDDLDAVCGMASRVISPMYVARGVATPNIPRDDRYYEKMKEVRGLIQQIKRM
jgi:hypothetical protein